MLADTTLEVDGDRRQAARCRRGPNHPRTPVRPPPPVADRDRDERRRAHAQQAVGQRVAFRRLSEHDIRRYIATGEPFDKAGAYGIQGHAAIFVEEIRGNYSGIMGLPLFETAALLEIFGHPVL